MEAGCKCAYDTNGYLTDNYAADHEDTLREPYLPMKVFIPGERERAWGVGLSYAD